MTAVAISGSILEVICSVSSFLSRNNVSQKPLHVTVVILSSKEEFAHHVGERKETTTIPLRTPGQCDAVTDTKVPLTPAAWLSSRFCPLPPPEGGSCWWAVALALSPEASMQTHRGTNPPYMPLPPAPPLQSLRGGWTGSASQIVRFVTPILQWALSNLYSPSFSHNCVRSDFYKKSFTS